MSMTGLLPDSYQLLIYDDRFILVPNKWNEVIVIDRITRDIIVSGDKQFLQEQPSDVRTIYGIWGVIRLLSGPQLVVITKVEVVGVLLGHTIYRVVQSENLPYSKSKLHLTELQQQDDYTYNSMLTSVLRTESFYYSLTMDLSHTQQRLSDTSQDFRQLTLFERADHRFVWNRHLLQEFSQQADLNRFCLPIMLGFVSVTRNKVNNQSFDYALISRRNVLRAGVRFYMRGVDANGNAANNVETEQIVAFGDSRYSFVQTRGSVPLVWSQRPNLRYKPTPSISSDENEQVEAMRRHLDSQMYMHKYGKQVIVNLLDHKGFEHDLERSFARAATAQDPQQIKYESFDFHHECSKMRWDRLSILIDSLVPELESYGYFQARGLSDNSLTVLSRQEGVFRTNCIDCLDRTNVVQSMIAWESLSRQLVAAGLLSAKEKLSEVYTEGGFSSPSSFEFVFKNVWADNADLCSKQYTATGALKTDFTRTGKRTKLGLVMDGYNSSMRYLYNNFWDGFRQDSIDLFLGNHVVEEDEGRGRPSPLREDRDWKYKYLPIVFLFALAMCVLCCLFPTEEWTEQGMYLLFWCTACIISLFVIISYGIDFVDKPKLKRD